MAYGVIVPEFWDDERLTSLTIGARLLAAFLCTGREAVICPGLVNLGVAGLAEAARMPLELVRPALVELRDAGFVQVDERARLILVPKAPKYNKSKHPNVLRSWFNKWKASPSSPLKAAYPQMLRGYLPADAWVAEFWSTSFGSVDISSSDTMKPFERLPESLRDAFPEGTVCSVKGEVSASGSSPDPDAPVLRLVDPAPPALDHESVYQDYPRKEGKSRGLRICKREVRTPSDLDHLRAAVRNYASSVATQDTQFIKRFDSFMGEWQDWIVAAPARTVRRTTQREHGQGISIEDTFSGRWRDLPGGGKA